MQVLATGNTITAPQLQRWLQHPDSLTMEDAEALQQLHQQYPWMSSTHKLLAYWAKKNNLSNFTYWNQYAALTSSNKHELFDLIHSISTQEPAPFVEAIPWVETTDIVITPPSEKVEVEKEKTAPSLADLVMEEDGLALSQAPIPLEWDSIPLEVPKESEEEQKSSLLTEEEIKEFETLTIDPIDLGELGHDIMSKAISSSIELEVSEPLPTASTEIQTDHETKIADGTTADWGDDFLNFIAESIGEKATPTADDNIQETKTPDVIERFIQKEPQITRGRLLDFEVGNMAKESLEEDYNLVTETMAKLYAKQGKIEKARKAYKKLIELFPEKSIYFATQLKNLNKKNQ
jgi:tetratricopeptide (TPR) repeat protein